MYKNKNGGQRNDQADDRIISFLEKLYLTSDNNSTVHGITGADSDGQDEHVYEHDDIEDKTITKVDPDLEMGEFERSKCY